MPNTRMPSISSDVAIGRRINGSEIFMAVRKYWSAGGGDSARGARLRGGDPHPRALGQPVLPVDDNLFAGLQALADDRNAILHRGHLDAAPLDRVARLDHVDVFAVGPFLHRLRGHRRYTSADIE